MLQIEQTVSEREKIESFISQLRGTGDVILAGGRAVWGQPQSTHRVAMTTFWRKYHHDGKISPSWSGRGVHAPPPFIISTTKYKVVVWVYDAAERADTLPLFLLYPCMYSVEQTVSGWKKNRILHFTVERSWWRHTCRGFGAVWGQTTEYTQNGNGHFLAYISSGWKNHYNYLLQ